ncbi:hypothetical protein MN608_10605 [Microdochium nivale]|nr:hypothetical protein MN608_10605 [Microdochium nivale]
MSGRSAIVRKKITDTKKGQGPTRVRPGSVGSRSGSNVDDDGFGNVSVHQMAAYPPTNGRLLKFSDSARASDTSLHLDTSNYGTHSYGSREGEVGDERSPTAMNTRQYDHAQDHSYAPPRRSTRKTEDVSGIEKSGFRSTVDKKSEEMRKNITKAFSFGNKKKKATEELAIRVPSAATHSTHSAYGEPSLQATSEYAFSPDMSTTEEQWNSNLHQLVSSPPSSKLPPLPSVADAPPVKRWLGGGRPVQKWNKLLKDPELWDPNGDVLVYYGFKGQTPRPNPSFRLSSHIIEATESRALLTLLREGLIEDEEGTMYFPPSPIGAPPMLRKQGYGRSTRLTPPASEDLSFADADAQISYHMFFPPPKGLAKTEGHRHAITTRNVFALLYHASLVGTTFYQALDDLLKRLDFYMPRGTDNVGTILNYLSARELDDTRNDPERAISVLAWSENPNVHWEEGWREAFIHSSGMYPYVDRCADFMAVSPITRALLDRAHLEMQLRVQLAEDRLAEFTFEISWPQATLSTDSSASASADRLRLFFIEYYSRACGEWPPPSKPNLGRGGDDVWLNRNLAQWLQRDFGALYDYLVDREVTWDESETRSTRKWMMVSKDDTRPFDPDTPDLPMTDVLIEYDNRMRYPHIPHPCPLVPDSMSPVLAPSSTSRLKKDKHPSKVAEDRGLERRVQLAYTEATNIDMLGSDHAQSSLVDAFVRFEKSDLVGIVDPSVARRGRWVLIYAILQILASVSGDSPNVRHKDGVSYHLSPRLKGTKTPPWRGAVTQAVEATHDKSYCWTAPRKWGSSENNKYDPDAPDQDNRENLVFRMLEVPTKALPHPPRSPSKKSSRTGLQSPGNRSARSSDSRGAQLASHPEENTVHSSGPANSEPWGHAQNRSVASGRQYNEDSRARARQATEQDHNPWPVRDSSSRANSRSPAISPGWGAGSEEALSPRVALAAQKSRQHGYHGGEAGTFHSQGSRHARSILKTDDSSDPDEGGLVIKDFDSLDLHYH